MVHSQDCVSQQLIPCVQKSEADALSRMLQENNEWVLHDIIVQGVLRLWGFLHLDLFATIGL